MILLSMLIDGVEAIFFESNAANPSA